MKPDPENFARWREDPITLLVFRALGKHADLQREAWQRASWGGGLARGPELERTLLELRTRADAYRSLEELTAERLGELLELEE